jgi:hypothetical protein
MTDRIAEILSKQIDQHRKILQLLESGRLRTRADNQDNTGESIAQRQNYIAELSEVLERHKLRQME